MSTKLMDKIREAKLNPGNQYVVGIAKNDEDRIAVVIIDKCNGIPIVEHTTTGGNFRQICVAMLYSIEDLGLRLNFAIERHFQCNKIISYLVSYKHGNKVFMDTHESWKERISRWMKLKPATKRYGLQITTVLRKLRNFPPLHEHYNVVSDSVFVAYLCALYVKERL